MSLWNQIDFGQNPPRHLVAGDLCYYAREYFSRCGYQASQANQLITNFKIPVTCRGTTRWVHKERAIRQFAQELSRSVKNNAVITAIPTSKHHTDPDFDSRLHDTLNELYKINPTIIIEYPILRGSTVPSLHSGSRRSVNQVSQSLQWVGFKTTTPQAIIIIDDVITCGTHFRACEKLLHLHHPEINVYGVFWAKAV